MPHVDPEKRRQYKRDWARAKYAKDPAFGQTRARRQYAANRKAIRARENALYAAAPEKQRAWSKGWRRAHPEGVNAQAAKHRAGLFRRSPVWADREKIKEMYAKAAAMSGMTGGPWHVDHVIPLRGRLVSGLHVHSNLQLLPGVENARKHNRYIPA